MSEIQQIGRIQMERWKVQYEWGWYVVYSARVQPKSILHTIYQSIDWKKGFPSKTAEQLRVGQLFASVYYVVTAQIDAGSDDCKIYINVPCHYVYTCFTQWTLKYEKDLLICSICRLIKICKEIYMTQGKFLT